MPIHLDVPIIGQQSQMSCWWACMRMVLRYFGQSAPMTPGLLNSQFNPGLRSGSTDPFRQRADPSHWYWGGVPPQFLGTAAELAGFSLGERHAEWTPQNTEAALRRYGPMIFYGVWSGFPHAVVLKGAQENAILLNDPGQNPSSRRADAGYSDMRGYDWLNERMSRVTIRTERESATTFAPPMYYPTDRPVRATLPS